ncbi:DUF3857 domain-containing protein [Flavobacterium sp. 102]|uniref:DUF3857 domain-containing protein n=1 Tax=Flavobacterium sp. 102 TaxID=2135623 RepID=UPI000EB2395C|nr:DUF3857 domain-containing protein [Flavobacterium sp. 102]RKS01582.1 uncharacterized protein DUF3857 [Flavobacterium sp. 102]
MFRNWMLFLFAIVITNVYSQSLGIEEVTKTELKQIKHEKDTSAPAAILYKKGRTYFKYSSKSGFTSYTEIALKIKIYKNKGLKWADFQIPYYIGYKFLEDEAVEIKKAYTYNLENDKIIKVKVAGESKFKDRINENWNVKKITFPNVKVGSIIELNYQLKTENLTELPDFQYQYEIPVDKVEYTTKIPEFYIYKGIKTGYAEIETDAVLENASQSFDDQYSRTMTMNYKQVKTSYKAQNIPALQEEEYVNNINNYYSKIKHELEVIRMPEEKPKPIATTWNDIAKSIYSQKEFGGELEKNKYFIDDLRTIVKETDSLETKMNKVFNHLKNRMNWDGNYGYYPRKEIDKAYDERTGNVAEINLILTAMLRLSGLEAYPILLSTRDNGLAAFPNKTFLNYVIASVNIKGKVYLLDATDKISNVNFIPVRALNQFGVLMKKDGTSEEIDLMPKINSHTSTNILVTINNEGEALGKVRNQYWEYNAYVFEQKNDGYTTESLIEKLEKTYQGLEVSEYTVQKTTDFSKPTIENYAFISSNSVEIIGDKMYVAPLLFFTLTENPFKQETRKYPVDFVFPHQQKFNISIKIPEGYSIEKIPDPKAIAMPDNLAGMKYNILTTGNQVQLLYTFDMNQAVIGSEYYEALKSFYKEMINKQTEKIVLKRM